MKIAILGFAGQGKSSYEYWKKPGNDITICDADENLYLPPEAKGRLGPEYLKDLDEFDLIIRTPIIRPDAIAEANPDLPEILEKVWSNTNEFFQVCPTKNIIGVTGTKGKGTTSTLIAKMLEASGKKVHLGGNIGTPPLDLLKDDIKPEDWVVLELANFQLIDLKFSPKIAVCLMVAPEHLDWHKDIEEYITAKQQLFRWQTVHDFAVYNQENAYSREITAASASVKAAYEVPRQGADPGKKSAVYVDNGKIYVKNQPILNTADVALLGRHNLENVCAAIAAIWDIVRHDISAIKETLRDFKGLEHRLEFVKEVNGVKYYNDSFGTTPETAMVALQSFDAPVVVILGGSSKKSNYSGLAHVVATHDVRKVVLIGDTADDIETALKESGYKSIRRCDERDMQDIVNFATSLAMPGDVVLLSPACASFDMFENYIDRGNEFKEAVLGLDGKNNPKIIN